MIKKLLFSILFLVVFVCQAQTLQKENLKHQRVKISNINSQQIQALNEKGIDLHCGAHFGPNEITLDLTPHEQEIIRSLNLSTTVIIDDVSKYYSDRAKADLPKAKAELTLLKAKSLQRMSKNKTQKSSETSVTISNIGQYTGNEEIDWLVPQNYNLGSLAGSLTLDEVIAELDDMRAKFPNLITAKAPLSTTKTTIQGRPIYYVKISDNPDIDENEPETLYNSLIHAREISTIMIQMYYMWYLLENYNTDPAIKNLVDNHELYFIPVLNPDGHEINRISNPDGGGFQRKNGRQTGSCSPDNDGVDLNRNFGYEWNQVTSTCSQTYGGTGAFSEPETEMYRDFVLSRNFEIGLDNHAFSNIILYPYSGTTNLTAHQDELYKYGHDMSRYNRYGYGSVNRVFIASGTAGGLAIDWLLGGPADSSGSTGSGKEIISFAPENGGFEEGGFYPSPTNITSIARRAMRTNLTAAYYSGKYAKFLDLTPSDIVTTTGQISVGIDYLGQTPSPITVTLTSISNNISSLGAAQTVSLSILQQETLNFDFNLNTGIQSNDIIQYEVKVENNDYVLYQATLEKRYSPTILFQDNPDNNGLNNWSTNQWEITTDAFSGNAAITNEIGSYNNNFQEIITLANPIDISDSQETLIQFYAKWDIERDFDYAQIQGSTDGNTWIPLVGNYTKPGSRAEVNQYRNKTGLNRSNQPFGEPIYDSDNFDRWVLEEIVINNNTNALLNGTSSLQIRFVFDPDGANNIDGNSTTFAGFTFDDFKVISTTQGASQDTQSPTVPSNITASNVTETTLTLAWEASADNVGVTAYTVFQDGIQVGTSSNTTFNITGLTAGTIYNYTVTARDAAGNVSAASNATQVQTLVPDTQAPTVPANVTGSNITDTSVILSWDASTDNVGVTAYTIFQDGTQIGTSANTTLNVTGLTADTTYSFTVTASDATGNISAASSAVQVQTLVASVTYCIAQGNDASEEFIGRFELNTINNTSTGQSYSNFTDISTVLNTNQSYGITIVPTWPGSMFNEGYGVWIDYNGDGAFDESTERVLIQVPTQVTPITGNFTIPTNAIEGATRLRVVMRYNTGATSCGSFNFGEVEDYTVFIQGSAPDTQAPTTPANITVTNITETAATLTWDASSDNVEVTNYTIFQDGIQIGTSTNTTFDVTGLTAATIYSFTVTAGDAAGNMSVVSNATQIQTLAPDTQMPTIPTNLIASNITTTTATLSWGASTDNVAVTAYTIFQDGTQIGTSNTIAFNVTGLTANTSYNFTVTAGDVAGNVSATSNVAQVQTLVASVTYCTAQGNNASEEFISRFELNTINNTSTGQSYSDFTSISTALNAGQSYNITIIPTWPGSTFNEGYGVWIDYNGDGTFDEATERVLNESPSRTATITGSFTVPASTASRVTRLRVVMRYNATPESCGSFNFGEVEDYTVSINNGVTLRSQENIPTNGIERLNIKLYPNPVIQGQQLNINTTEQVEFDVYSTEGKLIFKGLTKVTNLDTQSLEAGMYIARFRIKGDVIDKIFIIQ